MSKQRLRRGIALFLALAWVALGTIAALPHVHEANAMVLKPCVICCAGSVRADATCPSQSTVSFPVVHATFHPFGSILIAQEVPFTQESRAPPLHLSSSLF
jgi:hypothetical protein